MIIINFNNINNDDNDDYDGEDDEDDDNNSNNRPNNHARFVIVVWSSSLSLLTFNRHYVLPSHVIMKIRENWFIIIKLNMIANYLRY